MYFIYIHFYMNIKTGRFAPLFVGRFSNSITHKRISFNGDKFELFHCEN